MKKIFVSASIATFALLALAAKKNSDPVLMTVNGRDVHKSEFEYLFHKNNSQQMQPQTLEQYLPMFVDYKLKVADALAAGLDTTAAFRDDFGKHRIELAMPYMTDSAAINSAVEEAYRNYATELKVRHIMMSAGTAESDAATTATLDSLRAVLTGAPTEKWNEVAEKYTIDRGSKSRGGSMGWMGAGRLPWAFEKAAYATPAGQVSPVVNSGFGLHIIGVEEVRPARGEVKVRHILKLTARKTEAEAEKARQQIDSLYKVVTAPGADFAEVAKRESEDPGSARNGGFIDWFGTGQMVAEFDSASFAMRDGEISRPVKTAYGYHLIQRLEGRGGKTLAEMRPALEQAINSDSRMADINKAFNARLVERFNGRVLKKGLDQVEQLVAQNAGGYDSVARAQLAVSDIPVVEIGGKTVPVSQLMPRVARTSISDPANARMLVQAVAEAELIDLATQLMRDALYAENADYRNLLNEYRDGILLFDISNQKVWERAAKDREGLEAYFQANRSNYKWDKPKYKGFIVFATNDSVMNLSRQYAESLGKDLNPETFARVMADKFGRDVKVERVIAGKGENEISDYLFFDGPKPTRKLAWPSYYAFAAHLAQAPEQAMDVRGQVTTDYQDELQRQWLEQLRKQYPVKINQKVLKTIK